MKQLFILTFLTVLAQNTIAQNVGIGTTTPKASFNVADNKTVLLGLDTSGGGSKLIWYPTKSAFRAGFLNATGTNFWDNSNIGNYSFASGFNTQATKDGSTAMGYFTAASGQSSTALGAYTLASGTSSTAMGESTNALGEGATSFGIQTTAPSFAETVIGTNNTDYTPVSASAWNFSDRIFTVGNGINTTSKSDALVILKGGGVGIGVSNPVAGLNVGEYSNVLFGAHTNGEGSKLIWNPGYSAFRAGFLDYAGRHFWDDNGNLGYGSFATGYNTLASGFYSSGMGSNSKATGDFAMAMGDSCIASGRYSRAIGYVAFAPSFGETTIGCYNTNYTPVSPASWNGVDRIFTIGNGPDYINKSDAMVILKNGNTGFGSSNPTEKFEVVGEEGVPLNLVIGNRGPGAGALEFVSNYGLGYAQWTPGYIKSNTLGNASGSLEFYTNGISQSSNNNNLKGFEVKNGMAYTSSGSLGSYSDARLKNNITPFTDGLNVIGKINPVQFYYNADAPFKTSIQQTGIIAQELEQVAPYMVEKSKEAGYEDLRSVNNQAYTFLLINAVKEQQTQIDALKKDNAEMKKDNLEMKRQINKLSKQK